ncbi:helix-turn-helix transcriptional regulator [Pseudorhizobium endolithicum]|uniref:helix-turn-helix transcriptional regulator n=1 Tax=Pseudorhizobium endolithicum TaxID=1191678 RepID=UPI00115905EC|nr:helix-turn-helix transcriptional regulator [Pseudorhizobium endolithicum]
MGQATNESCLTPALCRAARALLDWTQEELAARSLVSRSTIRDFEGNRHGLHRSTAAQLVRALEEGGVVFGPIEGHGTGVCSTVPSHC